MSEAVTSTDPSVTRTVDGIVVPVAGDWTVDPLHSSLAFETRHFVVTRMRGRFRSAQGTVRIAPDPAESSVEITIDAASIDTIHAKADEHLRAEDFLDVEHYPTITFRSTGVRHVGADRWEVVGDLTIKGVTRQVTLDTTFNGAVPAGRIAFAKMGFTATTEIDRRDYGLTTNYTLSTGEFIVGNEILITLDVEADLPAPVGT